jgi:fumarylacetoacetase
LIAYGIADGRVVARVRDGVVAVGDVITDPIFEQPSLNAFMAQGPDAWRETRDALLSATGLAPAPETASQRDQSEMGMPFEVADYVDFYSSIHHATNLGRLFRPNSEPLLPNWRHLPVAYHGRSGTVVVSGTDVVRPTGLVQTEGGVVRQPSARLDIELEVGFVVGVGTARAAPIAVDDAAKHVFGVVLVNDWSARDIQAFEYQPLGPFLGKSFLTSISPWVVPLDELRGCFCPSPPQEPAPDAHLRGKGDWAIDINLEVERNGDVISRTNFADLYWTFAQQLAHMTSNGANVRTGDLFASGTVSGPDPGSYGSLIELGAPFLADGDTVVLRGWCGEGEDRIDLGDVVGTVVG